MNENIFDILHVMGVIVEHPYDKWITDSGEWRTLPHPGEIWHHFKGHDYKIIGSAIDSETGCELVLYAVEDGIPWARPLSMFMSEVDHKKYPQAKQRWRFERGVK